MKAGVRSNTRSHYEFKEKVKIRKHDKHSWQKRVGRCPC